MKTQISRESFKPAKRYSGIQQQQGRMLTDADWNELAAICREQLVQSLMDVIGNGSPRTGAVSITDARKIRPGDLYVDGIRAELPGQAPIEASEQQDLPGYPVLPSTGPYTIYADVWDRTVTALEDPELRDPGLHGADTCTRTQTMLQVKVCPNTVNPETGIPRRGNATLSLALHESVEAGDPCDPCAGLISAGTGRVGSYLFRVEVHAVEGSTANPTRLILKWSSENGAEQYEALPVEEMPPGFIATNFVYEFHDLTTEKHLGIFPWTGFTPTRGVLTDVYVIPASAPNDFVRRWDGFCEITRSGSAWSLEKGRDKGVELSTVGSEDAPGHVTFGTNVQINLGAMRLTLDLAGRTFIAGDFWLAPVREAVHKPGSAVLSGAEPQGATHHYLRLARVLADGKVSAFDNDSDKRRHGFPPLTDLRAYDVGYETQCSSGLFNATHDNVEKALNRICELGAEHVHYTADCSKGLYTGFAGTVKQALDLICSIQANHVGFTKPCDTSLYRGRTVATVQDALALLCDIQAGQVSYTPGGGCTFLDQPDIKTVQEALDALCTRSSGGGCRITVGEGGIFGTVEEALRRMLEEKTRDICLCLLPGDHNLVGQPFSASVGDQRVLLSGCGRDTRLHIEKEQTRFEGFGYLNISGMEIATREAPAGALVFNGCREVIMDRTAVSGLILENNRCLIEVTGARSVAMHDLLLEASVPESLTTPAKLLDVVPAMAELFQATEPMLFDKKLEGAVDYLGRLSPDERKELAAEIGKRVAETGENLGARELWSYQKLTELLNRTSPAPNQIRTALRRIRIEAVRVRPAVALAIGDAEADWSLRDCDIAGVITLYGRTPAAPLTTEFTGKLREILGQMKFAGAATIRISGCHITRIGFSAAILKKLEQIVSDKKGTLDGLFDTGALADTTLAMGDNQLAFVNAHLTSTVLEISGAVAARVIGDTSLYVGNRGGKTTIVNITPSGHSQQAANLYLTIQG